MLPFTGFDVAGFTGKGEVLFVDGLILVPVVGRKLEPFVLVEGVVRRRLAEALIVVLLVGLGRVAVEFAGLVEVEVAVNFNVAGKDFLTAVGFVSRGFGFKIEEVVVRRVAATFGEASLVLETLGIAPLAVATVVVVL